jgi:hypothetical protein
LEPRSWTLETGKPFCWMWEKWSSNSVWSRQSLVGGQILVLRIAKRVGQARSCWCSEKVWTDTTPFAACSQQWKRWAWKLPFWTTLFDGEKVPGTNSRNVRVTCESPARLWG